jgi:hypothetical protein
MENFFVLNRELSKRVLYNIGALPSCIGKISLTNDFYLQDQTLDVDIGESEVISCKIWSSQTQSKTTCSVCVVLSEVFSIFCFDKSDKNIFAFVFDIDDENDAGSYFIKSDQKWLAMDMVQKLNFVSALEFMNREGMVWEKIKITDKMYKNLCEIVETGV